MIPARMNRQVRVISSTLAAIALAVATAACGEQKISIPKSDPSYTSDYQAAVLFSQRCAGCHTLSYAGTHGSAANVRTKEAINGPNFNVRCERPVDRVLYAIENGGFSGAYMPANIFVGQQAREVALFIARFAGHQAPFTPTPGALSCVQQPIGTMPPVASVPSGTPIAAVTTTAAASGGVATGGTTGTGKKAHKKHKKK
jgi:mono/diheme cytochrome c family protein